MIGNFPAESKAFVRAYCNQSLDFEDESMCFRLPMAYVPAYMGDVAAQINANSSKLNLDSTLKKPNSAEDQKQLTEFFDALNTPADQGNSGLWDIQIQVNAVRKLERLTSVNHLVEVDLDDSMTFARLKLSDDIDKTLVPCKDFVLYIKEQKADEPIAIAT